MELRTVCEGFFGEDDITTTGGRSDNRGRFETDNSVADTCPYCWFDMGRKAWRSAPTLIDHMSGKCNDAVGFHGFLFFPTRG